MTIESYEKYLELLIKLVSIRSVYSDCHKAKVIALFCKEYLQEVLPNWETYQDKAGNIICFDPKERSSNRIYFSAHLDTVGAVPTDWKTSINPFAAIRTDTHIVGRGANDCKSGVAFVLHTAYLLSKKKLETSNFIFILSYREEGNHWKTASFAASKIGSQIPVGEMNALFCLENTVSVSEEVDSPFLISAYDSEPCNYFVSIKGSLKELRSFLVSFPKWVPVFIKPLSPLLPSGDSIIKQGLGGHSATTPNFNNAIHKLLLSSNHKEIAIWSGLRSQLSTVPSQVQYNEVSEKIDHEIIVNLRLNMAVNQVRQQLDSLNFSEETPFRLAYGSDRSEHQPTRCMLHVCQRPVLDGLKFKHSSNPGRSDASAYWNHVRSDVKDRMGVIVMGPGTRSHTFADGIIRKTHGADESFHIESGIKAMTFIHECALLTNQEW